MSHLCSKLSSGFLSHSERNTKSSQTVYDLGHSYCFDFNAITLPLATQALQPEWPRYSSSNVPSRFLPQGPLYFPQFQNTSLRYPHGSLPAPPLSSGSNVALFVRSPMTTGPHSAYTLRYSSSHYPALLFL